jgi:hypothetical protein
MEEVREETSTAPATACSRPASGSQNASDAGSALFQGEPLIAETWALKEVFRQVCRAPDRAEAERRLERFRRGRARRNGWGSGGASTEWLRQLRSIAQSRTSATGSRIESRVHHPGEFAVPRSQPCTLRTMRAVGGER